MLLTRKREANILVDTFEVEAQLLQQLHVF